MSYSPFYWFASSGLLLFWFLLWFVVPLSIAIYIYNDAPKHGKSQLWAILGFFTSVVGLFLYLILRGEEIRNEKTEGGEWFMAHGAKRGYFFLISLISLGVLFFGVADLIRILIAHDWLGGGVVSSSSYYYGGQDSFVRSVSFRLATVIVAFPIWILHWFHIQDQLQKMTDVHEQKLTFRTFRAYLYIVSGISALLVLIFGIWLLYVILSFLLGATGITFMELGAPLGYGLVSVSVFVYHFFILRDEKIDQLEEKLKLAPTEKIVAKQNEGFCPKCGVKVVSGDSFCPRCGTKV